MSANDAEGRERRRYLLSAEDLWTFMAMHWTFGSLPELGHLTREERGRLIARIKPWRIYAQLIFTSALIGLVAAAALSVVMMMVAGSTTIAFLLGNGSGMALAAALYLFQMSRIRKSLRDELKLLLAGERLPVCLSCGYNLEGTDSPHCPECGAAAEAEPP